MWIQVRKKETWSSPYDRHPALISNLLDTEYTDNSDTHVSLRSYSVPSVELVLSRVEVSVSQTTLPLFSRKP
jgi:hypothetical protein